MAARQDAGALAVRAQQPGRVGHGLGPLVCECARDHAAPPFCIAFQTVGGCSGMSRSRTPSASQTALTTAGVEAIVPASPMPFTPSGFVGDGVTVRCVWIDGISTADGMTYSTSDPVRSCPFASYTAP